MSLYCTNPTILFNPHPPKNYVRMYLRDVECFHVPYPKKAKITLSDLDSCYYVLPDGDTSPMYIAVPCGKCILCKDKKSQDWSTRSFCETQTSDTPPIFITLTFNNDFLPRDGLDKKHVQNFMKRLRIALSRKGFDVRLRYIVCGEYGRWTHRPHYHLVIWNFPVLDKNDSNFNIYKQNQFIQKAWSFRCSKVVYDGLSAKHRFKKLLDGRVYHYAYIGFSLTKPCDYKCTKYVTKYMRKECFVPDGQKPTFFGASRRRGIGYAYLETYAEWFRTNYHQLCLRVTDKYTGDELKAGLPSYYKRLLFPTQSSLVSKEVRDRVSDFVGQCRKILSFESEYEEVVTLRSDWTKMYCHLRDTFKGILDDDVFDLDYIELDKPQYEYVVGFSDIVHKVLINEPSYLEMYTNLEYCYNELCLIIDSFQQSYFGKHGYDGLDTMRKVCDIGNERKEYLSQVFFSSPDIDVTAEARKVSDYMRKSQLNEVF